MESRALCITPIAKKGKTDDAVQRLSSAFRTLPKPVIGRISDGRLLFDLRCLRDVNGFLGQLDTLAGLGLIFVTLDIQTICSDSWLVATWLGII